MYQKKKYVNIILYIILIMPFFPISYLSYKFNIYNDIINVVLLIGFLFSIYQILHYKKINLITVLSLIFYGVMFFSTYINNGDKLNCIKQGITIFSMLNIFDYGIKYNSKVFIKAVRYYLNILIIINFITILLVPEGLYISSGSNYKDNWTLGFKNLHILYIMPAILFNNLYSLKYYKKIRIRDYWFMLIAFASAVLVNSSTSMVGIILFIISSFFITKINDKFFNIISYNVSYIVIYFSIVIYRIQELFGNLIYKIFKKEATFTGRTFIWDYVMSFINEKKALGYGLEYINVRFDRSIKYEGEQTYHAHNEILEIIYKTGFIGFGIILLMFALISHKLVKNKNNNISKLISIFIFIFLIMMLTEFYNFSYIFYIFIVAFNVEYLIMEEDK